MKINEIELKSFKSIPDGTYPLGKVNFLSGKNGEGKTSFMSAVRYLITGNLPADPICHGKDHLSVKGRMEGASIERVYFHPDTWEINGTPMKEKAFQKKVRELRTNNAVLGKRTNEYFLQTAESVWWGFLETGKVDGGRIYGTKELELELPDGTVLYQLKSKPSKILVSEKSVTAKALNEFLGQELKGDIRTLDIVTSSQVMSAMSMTDFAEYLINVIPVKVHFDKLRELTGLTDEEARILSPLFPASPAPILVKDVTAVYKMLYQTRTLINSQSADWKAKADFPGILPLPSREQVQKELNTVNETLGGIQQLAKRWEVYNQQVANRQKASETYKKWYAEFQANTAVEVPKEKVQQLDENIGKVQADIEGRLKNNARMKQSIIPLQKMLENLSSKICPVCDRLVCETDKTACKKDLEDIIRNTTQMMQDNEVAIQKDREWMERANVQKTNLVNQDHLFQNKKDLYGKLLELRKNVPIIPEKPEPMKDTAELVKKKERLQKRLEDITLYENAIKAYGKYKELSVQKQLYNSLVQKSEPKKGSFTNAILEYVLGPFRNHCNDFIHRIYNDAEISFQMTDSGIGVMCRPHGRKAFLPVNVLSKGERVLVLLALMDMISSISGTGILFFDDLENLDAVSFDAMIQTVTQKEFLDRYDHIILSAVNHDDLLKVMEKYRDRANIIRL